MACANSLPAGLSTSITAAKFKARGHYQTHDRGVKLINASALRHIRSRRRSIIEQDVARVNLAVRLRCHRHWARHEAGAGARNDNGTVNSASSSEPSSSK